MHGYTYEEINKVMKAVKSLFVERRNLVFATSTERSLQMKLGELIEDMCEDHEYLLKNPPKKHAKQNDTTDNADTNPQKKTP